MAKQYSAELKMDAVKRGKILVVWYSKLPQSLVSTKIHYMGGCHFLVVA